MDEHFDNEIQEARRRYDDALRALGCYEEARRRYDDALSALQRLSPTSDKDRSTILLKLAELQRWLGGWS